MPKSTTPSQPSELNTSIFEDSQQKLLNSFVDSSNDTIESPDKSNFLNNNNTNNNYNERLKLSKADSIETDDDESDLHASFDLNESNISTKPLHTNAWDYRRPIVGPNG